MGAIIILIPMEANTTMMGKGMAIIRLPVTSNGFLTFIEGEKDTEKFLAFYRLF